jgi:uncharacterized membrane protein
MMGVGPVGLLLMLLLWGALAALAAWAGQALFAGGRHHATSVPRRFTARQIIDVRYARGELTRDQYDLMKQDLL